MVSELALFVSPVWLLILVLGSIYSLAIVGLLGLGSCRFLTLLGAGIGGVLVGQIASDVAGWRLVTMGDFHVVQTGFVALTLLLVVRLTARRQPVRR